MVHEAPISDDPKVCPHRHLCSGCCLRSLHPIQQQADRFFEEIGVDSYEVVSGQQQGWRTRAKLAVRQQKGFPNACVGLFKAGTHQVIPIPSCTAHHPSINQAAKVVGSLPKNLAYDEPTNSGHVKYIQASVERSSGKVQLALVLNLPSFLDPAIELWKSRINGWIEASPALWHSFWLNLQPQLVNTIFGQPWLHVWGEPFVWEKIGDCPIPFTPAHFCQANLEMFSLAVNDIVRRIEPHERVLELYAGMGIISLVIGGRCASATATDRDGSGKASFEMAKHQLHLDNVHFEVREAALCSDLLADASTLIVDPTRKGLPKELVEEINHRRSISSLWYLSCHFPSMERDLNVLLASGNFSVHFARSYVFFPETGHLETLVNLIRTR